MARLKDHYRSVIVPEMVKRFGYRNTMEVPRVEKITLNIGVGEATQNIKLLDSAVKELTQIAGQKPVVTRARKSVANFKLRQGMPIGCMVTLRGAQMYEFLDRFIQTALPRIRDFKGVPPKSFDGRGNYTLGVREQLIFPEIDYDKVENIRGMNITVCTTAKNDEEARTLLELFGMPFRKAG